MKKAMNGWLGNLLLTVGVAIVCAAIVWYFAADILPRTSYGVV